MFRNQRRKFPSSLDLDFQLREEKKFTRTQVRRIRTRRSFKNVFTDQNIVYWNCFCDKDHYRDAIVACSWCLVPYVWPFFEIVQEPPGKRDDWPINSKYELCGRLRGYGKKKSACIWCKTSPSCLANPHLNAYTLYSIYSYNYHNHLYKNKMTNS